MNLSRLGVIVMAFVAATSARGIAALAAVPPGGAAPGSSVATDSTRVSPAQPEEPPPPPPPPQEPLYRLASVPNMFGDFYSSSGQLVASNIIYAQDTQIVGPFSIDLPGLGGGRTKLAENNKALTMDRVFLNYSHFYQPLHFDPDFNGPRPGQAFDIDRYTLGMEKTLAGGAWSAELRLPLLSQYSYDVPGLRSPGIGFSSGSVGNLAVSLKRQLWVGESSAGVAGLGVGTPTGDDFEAHIYSFTHLTVYNESVHLLPYFAVLSAPTERIFWHAFLQLDVAANGNTVEFITPTQVDSFKYTEQNLLELDVGAGYWLYRSVSAPVLTGLAGIVEFHYTTVLQDADLLSGRNMGTIYRFTAAGNRTDIVDLAVGVHAELARTAVRVGGVFPVHGDARPFSSELQAQVERRF